MDSELEAILAESDGSDDGAAAGLSLEDILKEDEALGGDESPGLAQALSYARLREGGLGPRAAMAAAGASVGDLIVPTCSPRSQRSSPDRPDPPPILPKFEG